MNCRNGAHFGESVPQCHPPADVNFSGPRNHCLVQGSRCYLGEFRSGAAAAQIGRNETRSFVAENGRIILRVSHTLDLDGQSLSVISSLPVDESVLNGLAANLGIISISLLNNSDQISQPVVVPVRAGLLPPAANWIDRQITGPVVIPTLDWTTGRERTFGALLIVNTRPSMLKARLFQVVGESQLGTVPDGGRRGVRYRGTSGSADRDSPHSHHGAFRHPAL